MTITIIFFWIKLVLIAIDALLGCPIMIPTECISQSETLKSSDMKLFQINDSHLPIFIINWFVEVVNLFAPKVLMHEFKRLTRSDQMVTSTLAAVQQPSISNPMSSNQMQLNSILLRLKQIAHLRKSFFIYLDNQIQTKLINSNRPKPVLKDVSSVLPMASSMTNKIPSLDCTRSIIDPNFGSICFPTWTYQPERYFDQHEDDKLIFENITNNPMKFEFCFNCGIHLKPSKRKLSNNLSK